MFVGVVKLALYFPDCHSLKDKRRYVRQIKAKMLSKFSVSAAETGDQDKWQRAEVGFAMVSGDQRHLKSMIDQILLFLESLGAGEVLDCQKEIISW